MQLYNTSIRGIYTNVLLSLAENPNRTFSSEITAFWDVWWRDPLVNDTLRDIGRAMVASGQLTFFGGGWSQPDETVTRYEDLISLSTLGHAWLASTFGYGPVTTAWQADPFGHSNGFTYVQALHQVDGFVIGRPMEAFDPVNALRAEMWHPLLSQPDAGVVDDLTVMIHDHIIGYWEPMRDNLGALGSGNATQVAQSLIAYINGLAARPPHLTNILVMFGDDFAWGPAQTYYATLDAALAMINAQTNLTPPIHVEYSSPIRYFAAAAAEQQANPGQKAFPSRPGWDMVPLSGNEFASWWDGVFFSRMELKGLFHYASGMLRATQQMHAFAQASTWLSDFAQMLPLWKAVGLAQHHDAVTGDCVDFVADDYTQYVMEGFQGAQVTQNNSISALGGPGNAVTCYNASLEPCWELIGGLQSAPKQTVSLVVYNPEGWDRSPHVDLLLPFQDVCVSYAGAAVTAQSAPSFEIEGWFSFVFAATVPPAGFAVYQLQGGCATGATYRSDVHVLQATAQPVVLSNGVFSATFDGANFTLASLSSAVSGASIAAVLDVMVYKSPAGSENLWTFVTNKLPYTSAISLRGATPEAAQVSGPVFVELDVTFSLTGPFQKWRIYHGDDHVHVWTGTGPFNVSADWQSQDALVRITTNLNNSAQYYTDSNGLEFLPRVRNARPWFNGSYADPNFPVSCNMFPIVAGILMPDVNTGTSLAVLTDNSHAAGSQADGEVEWTVNRAVVNGPNSLAAANRLVFAHNILLLGATLQNLTTAVRPLSTALASPPVIMTANATSTASSFSALTAALPPQVRLLSVELLPPGMNVTMSPQSGAGPASTEGVLLLRLHNMYAAGEFTGGDTPVTVDLSSLFANLTVTGAEEMTVDGAVPWATAQANRVTWIQAGGPTGGASGAHAFGNLSTSLSPMRIRTFALTWTRL